MFPVEFSSVIDCRAKATWPLRVECTYLLEFLSVTWFNCLLQAKRRGVLARSSLLEFLEFTVSLESLDREFPYNTFDRQATTVPLKLSLELRVCWGNKALNKLLLLRHEAKMRSFC